ncbi:MAG: 8-oxo-dGTP pyrophosphatase MutT (NUDIX family) [Cellvibrionaceae bacterium]|jgi:8-oxo-dGTP pyrophosphatase MutT (NUDIX family)
MPNFKTLQYRTNNYASVIVDGHSLPADALEFTRLLPQALDQWRKEGFRSVWLEVPIGKAALITIATTIGFEFHSTDPDALTLTLRLVEDVALPYGATHQIGAGGVVINDKNELLVIVERAHAKTNPNYFKLPGGALDPGERIADAVEREVFEETGVKARFEAVATFRHWVDFRPNMSDIYIICRLTALSHEITPQLSEVDRALWMPLDDYLGHPDVSVFNKRVVELALNDDGLQSGWFEGYDANQEMRELFFRK